MNAQAELALIGAVLMGGTKTFDDVSYIKPTDFQNIVHQEIWAGIIRCADTEIDALVVSENLAKIGCEGNGHIAHIADIARNATSAANAGHFAKIVLERSRQKQIDQIIQILAGDKNLESCDRVEKAAKHLDAIFSEKQAAVQIGEHLVGYLNRLDNRSQGEIQSVMTGWPDVDAKINMVPGNLWIIAGRPKQGKTSIAMNIANYVSRTDPVLVFSMEMGKDELIDRQLSNRASIPLENIRRGRLSDDEWSRLSHHAGELKNDRLFIDDSPALTIFELKTRARQIKRRYGLTLIIVDYLQLMRGTGQNRNLEIQSISQGLKAMAKELDCPVIALSQLNRQVENRADKRPFMSDLRDSGSIEQDADGIIFIYRDEVYNENTHLKGIAEIIIAAQRNGGTGKVYLTDQLQYNRFVSFSGEPPRPPTKSRTGMDFNYE